MSQHLIHVCVTDAPAWSQREGGKSKRTQKSNRTGWVRGKKKKRGRGWGKRQHNGENEKEEREGKADKKTEIRLIRFLEKTKPK